MNDVTQLYSYSIPDPTPQESHFNIKDLRLLSKNLDHSLQRPWRNLGMTLKLLLTIARYRNIFLLSTNCSGSTSTMLTSLCIFITFVQTQFLNIVHLIWVCQFFKQEPFSSSSCLETRFETLCSMISFVALQSIDRYGGSMVNNPFWNIKSFDFKSAPGFDL